MTTLGNLGEPYSFYFAVEQEDRVNITCGTIESITAYYGSPSGSEFCPADQTPVDGLCPGKILTDTHGDQYCSRGALGRVQACFPSLINYTYPSYQRPCCALSLDANGDPDLSTLKLHPNYTCNSQTAQYIANKKCLGKSHCSLSGRDNFLHSLSMTEQEQYPAEVCRNITVSADTGVKTCVTSLGQSGEWDSCPNVSSRKLIVQVR